eukprot:CAMPEP_0171610792 /NCGR_PEP_ID=MMETSP0990-20121206/10257_1 /TAXON_ID=483369 /ORGANISM="non described non described, Strain CCMP2098" /LENGTH=36 /DNA_ID= /DNA_START= /DNA_END= /DNA_ORIENTATION=
MEAITAQEPAMKGGDGTWPVATADTRAVSKMAAGFA